ncbi:hypothetical protein ABW19_dt0205171 [Dactylella cylindrospora]|nr:hypothetical protein ABW19_dt0205171 [Dactylella cylindrospora]
MKFSTIILAVGAFAAGVVAQGLDSFPTCSQSCLLQGVQASGCSLTDFQCSCSSQSFIDTAVPCIEGACSADDVTKAREAAVALCKANGVDIVLPPAPGTPTTTTDTPAPTTTDTPAPTTTKPSPCKPKLKYRPRNVQL